MKLKVMSYNIQGHAAARRPRHLDDVAAAIEQVRPDVVGLQEVHRNTTRCGASDQARLLAELTGMRLEFGRTVEGWGGEYGNAVLSRLPMVSSNVHALPGSGEPRALQAVQLELPNGAELMFYVAHLEAWGFLRRATRAAQLHAVAEVTRLSTLPWVLVGDLNAAPNTSEIREFLKREHLQLCGAHSERSFRYSMQRLDYICASRHWKTASSRVARVGPSDHWPLVAELVL